MVTISALSGPLVAGVFAGVPAIWSSSLYVMNKAHGLEFSRSLTGSFMKTGILTILPYTVAARYFFSTAGIWFETLLAYLVICPAALLTWKLTNDKREVRSEIGSTGLQSQILTLVRGVLRPKSFDDLQVGPCQPMERISTGNPSEEKEGVLWLSRGWFSRLW